MKDSIDDLPISEIYALNRRYVQSAEDVYKVPRSYFSAKAPKRPRQFTQNKPRVSTEHYRKTPSPQDYRIPSPFDPKRKRQAPPSILKIMRYPFDLVNKVKKDNFPSPAHYFKKASPPRERLISPPAAKKQKWEQKITYLTQTEVQKYRIPGPGAYEMPKKKKIKKAVDYKRKLNKPVKKLEDLTPVPIDNKLFCRKDLSKKRPSFTRAGRFSRSREAASPGPGDYSLKTIWSQRNIFSMTCKPKAKSIYHC